MHRFELDKLKIKGKFDCHYITWFSAILINYILHEAVVSDSGSSLLRLFKQHVNLETSNNEEVPLVAELECESTDQEDISDEDDLNQNDIYPTFDQVDEEIQTTIQNLNSLQIDQVINSEINFTDNQEIVQYAYEDKNE